LKAEFLTLKKVNAMQDVKGLVSLLSRYDVKKTIDVLEAALHAKGVTIFARIDQQAEAEKVGLSMNPMELLIFGNPEAGTPLMVANPLSGIELPLKVLAWQDDEGKVWLSYNDFAYLQQRFSLPDDLIRPISMIEGLIKSSL
jgi:uncharacterized protein (DUF302 family)